MERENLDNTTKLLYWQLKPSYPSAVFVNKSNHLPNCQMNSNVLLRKSQAEGAAPSMPSNLKKLQLNKASSDPRESVQLRE